MTDTSHGHGPAVAVAVAVKQETASVASARRRRQDGVSRQIYATCKFKRLNIKYQPRGSMISVKQKVKRQGVHPVGFEPTSTNTFELESNPLDRSGTDAIP